MANMLQSPNVLSCQHFTYELEMFPLREFVFLLVFFMGKAGDDFQMHSCDL